MKAFDMIRDAISPMKDGTTGEKALYWFLRIGSIALCIFIVLIIVGLIYCKVKGIEIALPF